MLFPATKILPFTRQILALLGILIMQYARLGNIHHCIGKEFFNDLSVYCCYFQFLRLCSLRFQRKQCAAFPFLTSSTSWIFCRRSFFAMSPFDNIQKLNSAKFIAGRKVYKGTN